MRKLFVILDAGHGGMVNGVYTTASSKLFLHKDGSVAYEGVINRKIKDSLILLMSDFSFFDVSVGNEDISLKKRVELANNVYEKKKSIYNCLYVSIHSNAGGGTGFEVWTSCKQGKSDLYADIWISEIAKSFPAYKIRSDKSDGDLDKESDFYVLKNTKCPAVLGEYLFFDNYSDWVYQQTDEYISVAARSIYNFLKRAEKEVV